MELKQRIAPCLWFDSQAEEAARFYTGIFRDSRVVRIVRYPDAGQEVHHMPAGSVMTVEFEIEGQRFTALNGGPLFRFSEAISFQVFCDSQEEIDAYWEKLSSGGDPGAQQCGWLKDKFGLSWQIVPARLEELVSPGGAPSKRAFAAMLRMKKIDIAELEKASKE